MHSLHGKVTVSGAQDPFVTRITRNPNRPAPFRSFEGLLLTNGTNAEPGYRAYFALSGAERASARHDFGPLIVLPDLLAYVTDGDIVSVRPGSSELRVLYRRDSRFNSLLVTGACNNLCIMCSQPPVAGHGNSLLREILDAVPLMDISTPELVITGGEPTLLKDGLFDLIRSCRSFLAQTSLLLLSNGRLFAYLTYTQELANLKHPNLTVAVPLYSDIAHEHEFIVQAKGSFDQTILGLMNLARYSQQIELRVVIHKLNFQRLPSLAEFIARNLTFVSHVALMGMEPVGLAKANLDDLWVDPVDYGSQLSGAVQILQRNHICTSIYNHQLCTIDKSLWPVARQSISDWKNVFVEECNGCDVRNQCGGFFASGARQYSRAIRKVKVNL